MLRQAGPVTGGGTSRRREPKNALAGELQFSSDCAGVVRRLANVIRSGAPRAPTVALDTYGPRAIQIHRAKAEQGGSRHSKKGELSMENVLQFHCLVGLRCEKLSASGGKPSVRLLLVTESHIELYEEKVELFGVPLMIDQETSSFSGRDGLESLTLKESVSIDNLSTLELEMSAEPRARLAEAGGKELLLEFADDTAAMLFRHHMRRALWGRGQVGWTSASLGGERS